MVLKEKKGESPTKVSKDIKKKRGHKFSFDERYAQCKAFIKSHGHCKIPTNYKEDKSLGIWVQEVRRNVKAMAHGKKPRKLVSEEMVNQLNEINFHWGFTVDPNKFPELDASWEKNFEALKEYQATHGNFDVPLDGEFSALGKWTRVQRTQKYYRDGKRKCFITKDRIASLDKIGFDWKGPRKLEN